MEVARLQSELDNMAGLLRATEDSHTSAAAQSESEIRALNEQIQLMRESEKVGIESLNQAKDREIQRLKEEIVRLQEELNIRIKTAHSDEERFNANLVELKHELNRLESRNQSLTVAENDEVRILKQAL
jgi:phage host-nuclease inhibitor protein Gam